MRSLVLLVVVMTGCARIENAQPAQPAPSASAPSEAAPAAPSASAASSPASKPSGIGGPCFVSPVRTADGKPSAEQKCAPGLACDYRDAVPDGPGKCRRR
jgi:hypothetical protein